MSIEILKKKWNMFSYNVKVKIGEVLEKISIGHYGDRFKRWYHLKFIYPRWEKEQKEWDDLQFKSNWKWYDEWIKKQYDIPWHLKLKYWFLTQVVKDKIRIDVTKLKLKKPKEENE